MIVKKINRLIDKKRDVVYILKINKQDKKLIKRAGKLEINPINDIFI